MRMTWHDGAQVEGSIAIDPQDRGLLLGDGLFETILVMNGRAQWLERHLARMAASAKELAIPFSLDAALEGVSSVLKTRDLIPKSLRITLTRGKAAGGLAVDSDGPSLLVTAHHLDPAITGKPVTLITSSVRRNEHSPASRMKTLSYIDNILAARDARGRADDALMLNTAGRVACSTIGNVFALKGRELLTPAASEGVLPGIMRGRVLELAASLGYAAREGQITLDDAASVDAMFLTNSLRLIRPVTQLDGRPVGNKGVAELIEAMNPRLLEGSQP
jgi:branched-chain amino acid aminotransferase